LGAEVLVRRNDEIALAEIEILAPEAIFLSPGPCSPQEAGITVEVIRHFYQTIPILGSVWVTRPSAMPLAPTSSGPTG